jgi:prepilin-type N-terminal cleavage/methylation domain-containing protein
MRLLNRSNRHASRAKGTRLGFTLIELLVAMVIFGVIAGGIVQLIIVSGHASSDQAQRIDMQQNLRAANAVLPAELRTLNAFDGDIRAMGANSINFRANRQLGIMCTVPVLGGVLNGLFLVLRSPLYSAQRPFAVGDSVWVWYEGSTATRTDDGWIAGLVTAIAALNCPDGTAGIKLTVNMAPIVAPKLNANGVVQVGSPVWGFEGVTYATGLAADGRYYLNLTTAAGTAPVIGPLPDVNGVSFTYYDSTGAVTAVTARVRQIGLAVREQSGNRIRKGTSSAYAVDSLLTRITLRNNPRF